MTRRWRRRKSSVVRRRCHFTATGSSSTPPPLPCAVALGDNAEDLRRTGKVVKESLDLKRVVMIKYGSDEDGLREGESVRVKRASSSSEEEEEEEDMFEMNGCSGETAAIVALDPTGGLIAKMGLSSVLCVVGVARDVSLGEDMHGSRAVRAARRAAVVGVPTVVASAVTRSGMEGKIDACLKALKVVLKQVKGVISMERAKNCPRSHFPFPTNGRWASLGTTAFPIEDEALSKVIFDDSSGIDFASKDAWSFSGSIAPVRDSSNRGSSKTGETPERRRKAIRTIRRSRHDRDDDKTPDTFGRTLPMQSIAADETRADESGASFVRQLATESMIAQRRNENIIIINNNNNNNNNNAEEKKDIENKVIPSVFKVSSGTVVADDSHKGDVDAVSKGFAAISTISAWPQGHAFAILDDVLVESLREVSSSSSSGLVGLPSWLVHIKE
ncbi:unnamed protein product [Bathycoccus prasinos]